MLHPYQRINRSLSQELIEQARSVYTNQPEPQPTLDKLPHMLRSLKIQMPESMHRELARLLPINTQHPLTLPAFTQHIARAILEEDIENELRTMFDCIDKQDLSRIDPQELLDFVRELEGGERTTEEDIDGLFGELDITKVGYLGYEDFVYLLLPK